MSKKTKSKMSDDLPEEIRLEILHKLPIKSVVRFTCVSKSWLSLIKNPTFISTHLNLSISSSNKNPLLFRRNYSKQYLLYLDNEEYNHYMDFHFPFDTQNQDCNPVFKVVGTINGLICVVDEINYNTSIIIWNPWIKKSVTLPKPSITCYSVSLGFGLDSISNDYKVLRVAEPFNDKDENEEQKSDDGHYECEVYSLNMNSWKRIRAPRYEIVFLDKQDFVNGAMHTLAWRRPRDEKISNLILGFNVGDEEFKEIMLPESLANAPSLLLNILVYKESIAVFEKNMFGPAGSHVWVMEEYGVVESWTKIYTFNGQEGELPLGLGFMKNGGELLLSIYGGKVSCSLDSREIKHLGVDNSYSFIGYFGESMHLFDNANAQSDPTVENDATGDATGDATVANY